MDEWGEGMDERGQMAEGIDSRSIDGPEHGRMHGRIRMTENMPETSAARKAEGMAKSMVESFENPTCCQVV